MLPVQEKILSIFVICPLDRLVFIIPRKQFGGHAHVAPHFIKTGEPAVGLVPLFAGKGFRHRQKSVDLSGEFFLLL